MSAKAIREYDGKLLLAYWLLRSPIIFKEADEFSSITSKFVPPTSKVANLTFDTSILQDATTGDPINAFNTHLQQTFKIAEQIYPCLLTEKLVVKPDQLIKRRGKSGLLLLNADWSQVKEWICEKAGKVISVIVTDKNHY